ncbi:MAG: hypothetical protein HYT80_03790 [Euryarchaeota archaeon]|nr:hypothetical protein [Euryarchaeota archaeon]
MAGEGDEEESFGGDGEEERGTTATRRARRLAPAVTRRRGSILRSKRFAA